MTLPAASPPPIGPWQPGLRSEIPDAIRPLSTFLRPENVFTSAAAVSELCDFSGLDAADVVAFRPERLALHELLVRVTADLSVPDGSRIEDLGINFRRITRALLARAIEPALPSIIATYDAVRRDLAGLIEREVAALFEAPVTARARETPRRFAWFAFASRNRVDDDASDPGSRAVRIAAEWEARSHAEADPSHASAYHALARVLSAVLVRHGRLWGSREMLATLATDIACNQFASDAIGQRIEAPLADAAGIETYRRLPRQAHPVVMNTKGASASGKSTLRPLQKRLASEIGVDWSEFALISPDIWRKQLLDYNSLGPHYKYAGAFTGEELKIIDQKLDRYMARKAARGEMPHLLIDRFRFDSFAPDSDEAGSNLLTRFGQILYLFFMITPPASLVERAWHRGLEVGRYKSVDDTLAHGVEAYAGMPQLFFTWVQRPDKRVHFEFLDNSVRLPQRPRTVAFGWNDTMNILDVGRLLDVERYRRVNIDATSPDELYPPHAELSPAANATFLRACIEGFRQLNFAEQDTGRIYLHVLEGKPVWRDDEAFERAMADADTRAALAATLGSASSQALPGPDTPAFLDAVSGAETAATLGEWGAAGPRRATAMRADASAGNL